MEGHVSIYFTNGERKYLNNLHYVKYSYDLDVAEIGFTDLKDCLIKTLRVNLDDVERIIVK